MHGIESPPLSPVRQAFQDAGTLLMPGEQVNCAEPAPGIVQHVIADHGPQAVSDDDDPVIVSRAVQFRKKIDAGSLIVWRAATFSGVGLR